MKTKNLINLTNRRGETFAIGQYVRVFDCSLGKDCAAQIAGFGEPYSSNAVKFSDGDLAVADDCHPIDIPALFRLAQTVSNLNPNFLALCPGMMQNIICDAKRGLCETRETVPVVRW